MIDNFCNFVWTIPLKNKYAITTKNSFENILTSSEGKPNLIETDRGKEIYNVIFLKFSNKNNIKIYSRNRSLGAFLAERFNLTRRDLLEKPVFERRDGNWIDI